MTDVAAAKERVWLAHRVWQVLTESPQQNAVIARQLGAPESVVDAVLVGLFRRGRIVRTSSRGYAKPRSPSKTGKPKSRELTAQQLVALRQCCSVYGATTAQVRTLLGVDARRTSFVMQNLMCRGLVDVVLERRGNQRQVYYTSSWGHEVLARYAD